MSKRKMRVKAIELFDCETDVVSIVDRGAIRAPFKRFKSEVDTSGGGKNVGINLTELLGRDKNEPLDLLAIVVSGDVDLEKTKTALKAAGYETETMQEIDGCPVFVQKEAELTDDRVKVKINDNLAMVFDGSMPKYKGQKGVFNERIGANAFYPGVSVACETLAGALSTLVYSTEGNIAQKAEEALTEFQSYVLGLVRKIPQNAFKAESLKLEAKVKAEPEKKEETADEKAAREKAEAELAAKEAEKQKAEGGDLLTQMKALLDGHSASLDAKIEAKLGELTQRMDKSEKDTKDVLRRVVPGAIEEDDPIEREKNEDPFGGGCFDTGMASLMDSGR